MRKLPVGRLILCIAACGSAAVAQDHKGATSSWAEEMRASGYKNIGSVAENAARKSVDPNAAVKKLQSVQRTAAARKSANANAARPSAPPAANSAAATAPPPAAGSTEAGRPSAGPCDLSNCHPSKPKQPQPGNIHDIYIQAAESFEWAAAEYRKCGCEQKAQEMEQFAAYQRQQARMLESDAPTIESGGSDYTPPPPPPRPETKSYQDPGWGDGPYTAGSAR